MPFFTERLTSTETIELGDGTVGFASPICNSSRGATPMKPIAALEFSHLFELNEADAGLDVYQDQFGRPDIPDPPHPFEKFFNGTELRKGVGDVNDCAWNASLESPLDVALDKACASAQSAIEQFVKSNKHLLVFERLNCSELLKSFREERECQH